MAIEIGYISALNRGHGVGRRGLVYGLFWISMDPKEACRNLCILHFAYAPEWMPECGGLTTDAC